MWSGASLECGDATSPTVEPLVRPGTIRATPPCRSVGALFSQHAGRRTLQVDGGRLVIDQKWRQGPRSRRIRTDLVSYRHRRCRRPRVYGRRSQNLAEHHRESYLAGSFGLRKRRAAQAARLSCLPRISGAREWLVPEEGFEPTRPCGPRSLSPLRLPVPPLRLATKRNAPRWPRERREGADDGTGRESGGDERDRTAE